VPECVPTHFREAQCAPGSSARRKRIRGSLRK
jgi:hypothetical protein